MLIVPSERIATAKRVSSFKFVLWMFKGMLCKGWLVGLLCL